jgi:hypothetical protein
MSAVRIAVVFLFVTVTACAGIAGAQEVGIIAGQVIDASTGDPIIEAGVEIIGIKKTVRTDLDGRYSVKVPTGTHQVRFFAPLYQGARLEKVVVEAGKTAKADVPLKPEGQAAIDVVEVVAEASKAAEATQILKRQKAAVVSDNVGAETIAKSPDSDAAEIVARVPAVTIRDDKFIFVRGLGERYSQALLNRSRLPSPDPTRRVVPLDLFPAEFLESISILKTYTPDLPGDFSGGLADIELLDFPDQFTFGIGLGTKGNSNTTFQDFQSYKGSKLDMFGFGGDYRKLPGLIPDSNIASESRARRTAYGQSLKNIWEVDQITAPLDYDISFQVANRWGPLGVRLGVLYETQWRRYNALQRQFIQAGSFEDPEPKISDDFRFDVNNFEVKLGAVMTAAYELSPNHRFTLRSLVDRNSTDQTQVGIGTAEQNGNPQLVSLFSYKQDQLGYGQLGGTHHFSWIDVDWRSALSQTTENVPDERITNRVLIGDQLIASNDGLGGTRNFQSLDEWLSDSGVDFTIPFATRLPFTDFWSGLPGKVKFGPAYANRKRDASIRIFRYNIQPKDGIPFDAGAPLNDVFNPGNVGSGQPPYPINFNEQTNPGDAFEAQQEIFAGYGMLELPLIRDQLRFIGGVRVENSYIQLDTFDVQRRPRKIIKNDTDPLPGVNLVYSPRSDMNLRFGWSQTVSRPEFRELSPAVYPAPRGLRGVVGNPDLVQAGIDSYDLRWEWFFSPTELVSIGGFYKTIDKPIEQAIFISGSSPQNTFQQNEDAKLYGFEFEARKNFGFISPWLENLSFLTNVSYVESEVTALVRPESATEDAIYRKRALQGQSPYVVNAALEYAHPTWGTARLLYNTVGPTITSVQDRTALPDFEQQRRDQLDLVYLAKVDPFGVPLKLKLSVENVLNDNFPTTVGDDLAQDYKTGVTVGFGISYQY